MSVQPSLPLAAAPADVLQFPAVLRRNSQFFCYNINVVATQGNAEEGNRHERSDKAEKERAQIRSHQEAEAWKAVVALGVDLLRAIESAVASGAISNFDRLVLILYYWRGDTLAEIADLFDLHEDVARRSLHKALRAIRDTGLLEGYAALE